MQAIPGIPPLPEDYNPATWMLEVSFGEAKMRFSSTTNHDFAALYRDSELCARTAERVEELINSMAKYQEPLTLASQFAVPFWRQTVMVTWKMFVVYWCSFFSFPFFKWKFFEA